MDTRFTRPFYLLSLYYRDDVFSGANKRFANIAKNLRPLLGDNLKLIVSAGEEPDFVPAANVLTVPAYSNPVSRLQTFRHLRKLLANLPAGRIISDFMPIPFTPLRRHRHYQLIHDLRNFTEFSRGGLAFMSAAFQKRQLRKCRTIITVSEQSKTDIIEKCQIPPHRILVSYNGISDKYVAGDAVRGDKYDILYVGLFEHRKNHMALLEAVKHSPQPLRICLVGSPVDTHEQVRTMCDQLVAERGFTIDILDQVGEEELIALYRGSRIYACPSLLEGFGMPLVEAMANACQVVCSDIPVFREICDDAANYFDARDPASIWQAIAAALDQPQRKDASAQLDRFSWLLIAKKLLADIEKYEANNETLTAPRSTSK